MSDEIDLDQSHLCTTEDAFEQFQAVSMYEEDEFITLSDIVPPQPQAPDLSGELNDIPYENEVVLDSNLEEQVPEVNSTIDIIADENLSSEAPQRASENLITPENSQPPTFNDSPPSKRGRKNKIQKVESFLTIEDKSEEHNGTPDISQSSEAVPLTPANLPKRGRRPRNVSQTQDNSVTDDSALDSSEFSVSVSKRTNRTRLPSRMTMHNVNNPQIDNATTKKAPARRGRPRKSLLDQQTVQENSSFEIEQHDTSMKNKTDMSLIEKQVPKKRGRKKKTETENEYKTNLEESKEPDQACDLLVEHHAVVSPIKKIPGKRGRPRKIQNNDKPKNDDKPNTESVGNVPKIDDDDGDDICLSQLKSKDDDPIQNSEDKKDLNLQKDSESNGVHTEDITIEISEEPSSETPEKITLETSEEVSLENTDKMNSSKRNSKQPVMEDFEYNIDSIVSERKEKTEKDQLAGDDGADNKESLLVEDTSKRPVRRKAKQQLQYDEGSDEDPFANVELSDEDDMRGRKGRYYSDDEYIPGTKKKRGNKHVEISGDSDTSDSDIDNVHEEMLLSRRKRSRKSEGSPKKRGRKSKEELAVQQQVVSGRFSPEVSTIKPKDKNLGDDDVEICLETSIIKSTDDSKWGASNEFENFLAKKIQGTDIKIKKASAPVQPLEIPVIDPNEAKKSMEISTQTAEVPTTSTGIQTTAPYDVPMKENVQLTADQSEKACEFLNNIVKTTAELGELMTQKSEDFIKKKINTNHVTDTFKMDYCVRKSFLLFKLAKHNLMQMEEDLAQQYDDFLKTHNLSQYMEKPKVLEAEQKDSDSDCEIIETPAPQKPKKAVPFNPKTVFLNKELSIKIAKKPTDDKKLNIKGRHTVWINDSVMVKKVKPTQSFLAQDSRNKKPPDSVTIEMVSAFFKQYYRKRALATCAPFVSTEWVTKERTYVCNYFFANTEDFPPSAGIPSGSGPCENVEGNISTSDMNDNICNIPVEIEEKKSSPKTLFSLCTQVLQNHLQHTRPCLESKVQCDISPKIGNQNPLTLYRLCIDSINIGILNEEKCVACVNTMTPSPLKTLCHKIIADLFSKNSELGIDSRSVSPLCTYADDFLINSRSDSPMWDYNEEVIKNYLSHNYMKLKPCLTFRENNVKSLLSLCLDLINTRINPDKDNEFIPKLFVSNITCKSDGVKYNAESLKSIAFKCVVNLMFEDEHIFKKYTRTAVKKVKTLADICFEIVTKAYSDSDDQVPQDGLTIDAVNTLTEEAYHNIDQSELTEENAEDYYPDDNSNFYDDETESGVNNEEETSHMEDNWLSQVKMKISSCYDPNISTMSENAIADTLENSINNEPIIARVKLEPVDDVPESVDTSIVKSEPTHLDEMTIIPESIITKSEYLDPPVSSSPPAPIQRQNSSSFDVDQFEAFVSTNKMMCNMNTYDNEEEQIFSQSTSRIRRQYEPDSDTENDMNMSLLIPQTYEPMPVHEKDKAKNSLMESSSDENSNNKKVPTRRKPDRRSRARAKKNEPKSANNKEIVKDKPTVSNELAMLTRRMRDKIRQEEKKVVSSDSEHETEKIVTKKGKDKLKGPKPEESTETAKDEVSDKVAKPPDDEIQCSNVDSTEQVNENVPVDPRNLSPSITNFTGFSAGDQNEVASYHKYVKYVYNQIVQDEQAAQGSSKQPLINPEEPVELLECEPAMPFFMVEEAPSSSKTATKKDRSSKKAVSANTITKEKVEKEEQLSVNTDKPEEDKLYVERHGWKCFALDGNDTKLYQNAQILLEKLPESFVETYFKYQDITTRNCEDDEVDKLTNLQTLNRPSVKEGVPEGKCKGKPKCKIQPQVKDAVYSILGLDQNEEGGSRPASPANSEHYDEFTPSEDEGGKVNEQTPPTVAKPPSDNNLAKNSLMDDNDSDNETKVKQEPKDPDAAPSTDADTKPAKKYKPGPKCKKMKEQQPPPPMMLTADKMMNKELNLLHAPVNLEDDAVKTKTPAKGPVTRNKQKSASKTSPKVPVKTEDDSSSEEEKQWFTIKEKLLKRMVKKQDTTREDDAKRAKLVSEFIERRGDGTESYIKKRRGVRGPRSKKRLLERQKQLRVLTRELFGDPSNDASLQRKKQTGAYFKGRRNIRKVIDKKSLAKNTVVANKEEFERKRRINIRQTKLREVLCCEEGVNVLVINDEVCLEYDFELHRPVVTVHPFFTKVMKAHQYEGVKFMWDACFESLESIATGNPGSGCILAHCMGLGKTLQVLALLHTVLTHPGAGMRRVLVCCPLSTVLNWVDEIHKWIGPVTNQIKVFELSKLRKTYERAYQLEDWYNGGGIFIIGYELFRSLTTLDPFLDDVRPTIVNKIRTALLDPGPDIIICDEGHLLKNDCSVLAVAMSRVATARRVVLTGTPMQNNLREYYCMVNFVKPNLLGTYAEFSNRFENPIMNGQHRDSREEDIRLMKARTHILHKVLEGCLQRQEASVLYPYLPKKHEYTVFISLTKCQWDLYKHYLCNYGNTQNNKSILKDFHILQKIWSHPQVLHNFQMRVCDEAKAKTKVKEEKLEDDLAHEDLNETADVKPSDTEVWWLQYLEGGAMLDSLTSSNKFVAVFRILDESVALGDKVLIFSTSLFTMDALEFFLKKINKWSLGQEYYRLDGSVPAEVRQKWCREFNAENNLKTKLFLISTRAGSLGLNMTAANRVIILDTSWNPAHDIQSIFRVYRFGQKKDCFIYRLVALGTMEQKIYERSVTKQAVACRVVDEQQIDRHYNMAELTELYKYDEAGVGVAGGVAVGVEDVVLLRVARDAALHAVHEHDSLLRGSGEQGLPEHERNAAWMQFQQEHAHKQMQEDAIQQQKLKKEEAQTQPPKRPPRKYAKLKLSIKPVKTEESILPETAAPGPAPAKQRGRKTKKANVVSCCIPIQPETAATDPEKEAAMVRKIANILLEYDFQKHKTPAEVSALVSRVREIISSGQMELLDSTDAFTMSIANVFLGKDEPPMPPLTVIAPEEPGPSAVKDEFTEPLKASKQKGRKRGSGKKMYVYEEEPSTSAPPPVNPSVERSRTRRRAAIAAERNFDTITDSVIDIEDEDWRDDSDSTPISTVKRREESQPKDEKQAETRVRKSSTIKLPTKAEVVDTTPKKITESQDDVVKLLDDSILLSDDDEAAPPKRKPGPAGRTLNKVKDCEVVQAPESQPEQDGVGVVPLHPTLLSNKNFIKIVAHTYLSGNPMLDEDAATLAAQYSTFKALKEYQSTRKDVVSGPIYDIAVKVLGIDVLKKLYISNVKIVTSKLIATHPLNSKEAPVSPQVAEAPPQEARGAAPIKIKIRVPPAHRAAPACRAAPVAAVVPVGLYKRAEEGPSLTADECILPDDDDIHIICDPTPPPPRVPAILGRRKSRANLPVADEVAPDPRPAAAPSPPRVPLTPAAPIRVHAGPAPPREPTPAGPTESILSDLAAPISLDSDDEDSAAPRPAPPAAPILVVDTGRVVPPPTLVAARRTSRRSAPPPSPAAPPPPAPDAPSVPSVPSVLSAPGVASSRRAGAGSPVVFVVPAGGPGRAPAVPVALSKAQMSPRVSSPHLTRLAPEPGGAQARPSGAPPAAPAPPAAGPQPPPPPQAPPTQVDKNKRLCKPGDILRITASGEIEVLKRRDLPPEMDPPARAAKSPAVDSAASNKTVDRRGAASSSPAATTSARKIYKNNKAPQKTTDHDPLSILKDVIHIEADDYDTSEVKAASKTAAPVKTPDLKTSAPPAKAPATSKLQEKWLAGQSHNSSKQITDKTVIDKGQDARKTAPDQSKTKERILGSVDLTDLDAPTSSTPVTLIKKSKGLKGATTVVGTSKSIILCAYGKAVSKVNSGAEKRETSGKEPEKAASTTKKVELKKRPAPVETTAAKKKKTDKLRTLRDFDIDAIEGIIELD